MADKRRVRLGHNEKQLLLEELFAKQATVTKKDAEKLLRRTYGNTYEISGLADEKKIRQLLVIVWEDVPHAQSLLCE